MMTAGEVLDVARGELGTKEQPLGSNRVKYNDWYYNKPVTGSEFPWCAVFQSWVADQAGATTIIPRHAYTPAGAQWFKDRRAFDRTPRVGSLVFYHWPNMNRISHVGIVEAVNSDGSWIAIEGNTDGGGSRTGGQVMRQHRRSLGNLGGFGHPAYSAGIKGSSDGGSGQNPAGPPAYPGRVLKLTDPFMTGEAVRIMQTRLKLHLLNGFGKTIDADGEFGPLTDEAVRWFQTARDLTVDGEVGRITWTSLWK